MPIWAGMPGTGPWMRRCRCARRRRPNRHCRRRLCLGRAVERTEQLLHPDGSVRETALEVRCWRLPGLGEQMPLSDKLSPNTTTRPWANPSSSQRADNRGSDKNGKQGCTNTHTQLPTPAHEQSSPDITLCARKRQWGGSVLLSTWQQGHIGTGARNVASERCGNASANCPRFASYFLVAGTGNETSPVSQPNRPRSGRGSHGAPRPHELVRAGAL